MSTDEQRRTSVWHLLSGVLAKRTANGNPYAYIWRTCGEWARGVKEESECGGDEFQNKWNEAIGDLMKTVSSPKGTLLDPRPFLNDAANNETNLLHVEQRSTWDCGVACLEMVLHWLRDSHSNQFNVTSYEHDRGWLEEQIGTRSVWSIDLVICLIYLYQTTDLSEKMASLKVVFVSRSLAVNEEHSELGYYREAFDLDQIRVQNRFKELADFQAVNRDSRINVITLECGARSQLTIEALSRVLAIQNCIAIILLDNNVLKSRVYGDIEESNSKQYEGHYILLKGVYHDGETLFFVAENPSSSESPTLISSPVLEASWRTNGTDEDLILLFKKGGSWSRTNVPVRV